MEDLMNILKELRPDVNFEAETALIDDGILDSFDIISLVSEINEKFSVNISPADLEPENFNSAENMMKLIESLS